MTKADRAVGGVNVRLILALGDRIRVVLQLIIGASHTPLTASSGAVCILPVISVWWNRRIKSKGQQTVVETHHVVYGSLALIPVTLVWLSDPAIRCRPWFDLYAALQFTNAAQAGVPLLDSDDGLRNNDQTGAYRQPGQRRLHILRDGCNARYRVRLSCLFE